MFKRRTFLSYALLFMLGCSATTNRSNTNVNAPTELKLAVTDILEPEVLKKNYEPFRAELETILGIPVELYPSGSFTEAAVALQAGTLNFVLAGPSEYVVIHARTNAVPVIAITRPNYLSVIAIPSNSNIKSLSDLKGKTIAMSDIGSTSGHLGPTKMLMAAGLDPQSDLTVKMLGDQGSITAIQQGTVDAWAGSFIDYQQYLQPSTASTISFPILEKSPPLPNDVFIASQTLEPEWIEICKTLMIKHQTQLIQALLIGEKNQKYQGSQLAPVSDGDYDVIRDAYKAIGQGEIFQ